MSYYSEATTEVFNTIMGCAQGVTDILSSVKRTKNTAGYLNRSSIMKAAKDLVMSFPVLCADTISPETANMVVKAIERNCVTTLQLLFSAANLRGEDGMQVLQMWHKNMDNDRNMDDYLDAVDAISLGLGESGVQMLEALADKFGNEMVTEFTSACRYTYPEHSFNESSLMRYSIREGFGGYNVYTREDKGTLSAYLESVEPIDEAKKIEIHPVFRNNGTIRNRPVAVADNNTEPYHYVEVPPEAIPPEMRLPNGVPDPDRFPADSFMSNGRLMMDRDDYTVWRDSIRDTNQRRQIDSAVAKAQAEIRSMRDNDQLAQDKFNYQQLSDYEKAQQWRDEFERSARWRGEDQAYQQQRDAVKDKLDRDKYNLDKAKFAHQRRQDALRNADAEVEFFHKQLLPSDVKKANELVPSMMIIRFNAIDPDGDSKYTAPNYQQFIAGVKARLIAVSSMEIIEAIRSTNRNKVNFTNLVRATTKEISFCRDFIAGIEQAKIDAKKNSKLSKTSPIWRSLQWRSSKSVMNRLRRNKANDAGAITTLVLTSEEVNFMKSEYNIDLNIPNKAKEIMETYNLMCLCIVDEEVEVARFLFDGDKYYQDYSFSALERETGDSSYKKIINLMSKMNR